MATPWWLWEGDMYVCGGCREQRGLFTDVQLDEMEEVDAETVKAADECCVVCHKAHWQLP